LAARHHLTGWVRNTSSGVEIEVSGQDADLRAFLRAIQAEKPPLARIDTLESQPVPPAEYTTFTILVSQAEEGQFMPVAPDMAICPDCRRELFDPADRRCRYPFINCTNCGPRFSILQDIPYDRPKTTMSSFALCPSCQAEYDNPRDRRFHAQPVACPECGPQVQWVEIQTIEHVIARGATLKQSPTVGGDCCPPLGVRAVCTHWCNDMTPEAALQAAREALQAGKIVAVKGLGGFHLACDAANQQAVDTLRRRKKRSDKPFALMAFDLAAIERHAEVTPAEAELLRSPQSPIVLLARKPGSNLAAQVAPGQRTLGFMLPYTPLHLLLLEPAPGFPEVLVMTSGNLSEEPVAYLDDEGQERLAPLADAFLLHDRPIHMRTDDSVARVVEGRTCLLRRARGYAPNSIRLPGRIPSVLAAGAELKNTFCLTRDEYAFLSHHIGDMENYETLRSFDEGIQHFQRLFRIQPQRLACDLHPDYLSTRSAEALAAAQGLPLVRVQHHHAHLAACLADNGWATDEPVMGLIFDGTGLGTDGAIWGGEVLVGGYAQYTRAFHLAYAPLPGGDISVRKPSRMALAHLWQAGLDWEPDLLPVQALCFEERTVLRGQLERRLNSPETSSIGRLFDAASALIGVRQLATYEAQAAIEMEALADPQERGLYPFDLRGNVFDPLPLWLGLLRDWRSGTSQAVLAARFHNSLAQLCLDVCRAVRQSHGCRTVALSGGVWQNTRLLTSALRLLAEDGFQVLWPRQAPANDGGISLGQAVIAGTISQRE
jgi:hydrogenase maturation protein HypF